MEEETTETNKIITTYEVEGSNLKEIRTPEEIQPEVISYDITATIAEIEKKAKRCAPQFPSGPCCPQTGAFNLNGNKNFWKKNFFVLGNCLIR